MLLLSDLCCRRCSCGCLLRTSHRQQLHILYSLWPSLKHELKPISSHNELKQALFAISRRHWRTARNVRAPSRLRRRTVGQASDTLLIYIHILLFTIDRNLLRCCFRYGDVSARVEFGVRLCKKLCGFFFFPPFSVVTRFRVSFAVSHKPSLHPHFSGALSCENAPR